MSGQIRYRDDFKKDAVSQVVDRGYSVRDVADRLGISTKSLYTWKAEFSQPDKARDDEVALVAAAKSVAMDFRSAWSWRRTKFLNLWIMPP